MPRTDHCCIEALLQNICVVCVRSFVLLLVELVNDDTNQQVEGEETSKHNEQDKIDIEVQGVFSVGLLVQLK